MKKNELKIDDLIKVSQKYYDKIIEEHMNREIFYTFPSKNKELTFWERLRANITYKIYEFRIKLSSWIAGFDITDTDY